MTLLPGFRDPVLDSLWVFRSALMATARPGQSQPVENSRGARLELPHFKGIHAASLALLLALADLDTPLWLDERLHSGALLQYLRFHTGADITPARQQACFGLFGEAYEGPYLADFPLDADEYPERAATLIIQATDFVSGAPLIIQSASMASPATLRVAGVAPHFWDEWRVNQELYPCGIDVVFTAGDSLLGLPPSATVASRPTSRHHA